MTCSSSTPLRSLEWVIGDASQFYSRQQGVAAASAVSVMAARRMHARLPVSTLPILSGEYPALTSFTAYCLLLVLLAELLMSHDSPSPAP